MPKNQEWWCVRAGLSSSREIYPSSPFLFYPGPQQIGWCSPTLGRAVCFTQFTDSNANHSQKHSDRHTQKQCFYFIFINLFWPYQVACGTQPGIELWFRVWTLSLISKSRVLTTGPPENPQQYFFFFSFFFFLATSCGFWNLSFLTMPSAMEMWSPRHWTSREFPRSCFISYLGIP